MLNIKIITVGGIKEDFYRRACEEYVKRLSPYAKVDIIELKEGHLPEDPNAEQIKTVLSAEGAHILAAIPPRAYSIALCVEGKSVPSEVFAANIAGAMNTSSCICFIIGSSHGLAPEVKKACRERLSFSAMTFPHQLMRVILCEQIYRAFMINHGRTYHK